MPPLLPVVSTPADYARARQHVAGFLPAVLTVAARHGLPAPGREDWLDGSDVVFGAGPDAVLKLWAPCYRAEGAVEQAALRAAARCEGLPVPDVLGTGDIEGWPYVVQRRLPGRPAGDVWRTLPEAERLRVLREVGGLFAKLHRLPPLPGDWPAFLETHAVACVDRQRRWGFPAHLVAEIPAWLAAAGPLAEAPAVFLHADVTPYNLLLDEENGRWGVSGLVDFGDAMAGHAEYDLMVPAIFLARGNRARLEALFAGAGYAAAQLDDGWRARLTALALVHRYNDMTRFLDDGPPASLAALTRRLWP